MAQALGHNLLYSGAASKAHDHMQHTFDVEVQPDFLERLAAARPVQALAELVWNAFDADASDVRIEFDREASGLLEAVRVQDNGHGIRCDEAPALFTKLGGSWKRVSKRSHIERRLLHGEEGKGRFRALALGRVVDWHITASADAKPDAPLVRYTITIGCDRPRQATMSDFVPAPDGAVPGVEVVVSELFKQWQLEDTDEAAGMVPPLNVAIEEARDKLRDHFRARAAEKIKDYVQGWKNEHVYPYEEEPQTPRTLSRSRATPTRCPATNGSRVQTRRGGSGWWERHARIR